MNDPDTYQRINASRYGSTSGGQYLGSTNRCSCVGVGVAAIVVGLLITLPSILNGSMIFVGFMDNPILYILSSLSLYGPLLICGLVIWFAWKRRGISIPE